MLQKMENVFPENDMSENGGQDYLRISVLELKVKGKTICEFQRSYRRVFYFFRILSSRPILIANVSVFIEIGKLSCSLFSLKSVNCLAH